MVECEYCGKPLKAIGHQRTNGRSFSGNSGNDWKTRKYHKKCFKKVKERENIMAMLADLKQAKYQG